MSTAEPGPGAPAEHRVSWTYALSQGDLRRLLPRLVAPQALQDDGHCLAADYPDGRRLRIELGAETERRLGSIRLRDTTFTFVFVGWESSAIRAFLVRCSQGLQQGGG